MRLIFLSVNYRIRIVLIGFLFQILNSHSAIAMDSIVDKNHKPNILWIVSEDNSPLLGAYGDDFATTPNIDLLAQQSIVFNNAFANTPVCAPSRFSILTGMHANAMGTNNMRSRYSVPDFVKPYTDYLRAEGYHVTNNNKTDYNYASSSDIPLGKHLSYKDWQKIDSKIWDKGTYTDRQENQPFFHVYNIFESHESQLHSPIKNRKHDPERVKLPPYHPDTPEIRADWALYYDRITQMDHLVGQKLSELKAANELKNTIVFYYSDHGGALARSKRFLYDTGTKIPLMVYVPEKFKHLLNNDLSNRKDQIVDLVDLAPSLFYLAGIEIPEHMHGQNIFKLTSEETKHYSYLYRGRMDVRIDLVRALRSKQFKYIRNYMPHRPNGQHLAYLWKAPSVRSWQSTCLRGECNTTQERFWQNRQAEELYDTTNDPWEVNNLVGDPDLQGQLLSMRKDLKAMNRHYKDIGFIPEGELVLRTQNTTGYDLVRQADFPINLIIETAELASRANSENLVLFIQRLSHPEAAVRYWAAVGCGILQAESKPAKAVLISRLNDPSADVRIAAAEALIYIGAEKEALTQLMLHLKHPSAMVRIHAANVLEAIGSKAEPIANELQAMVDSMQQLKAERKLPDEYHLLTALSYTASKF